MLKSVQWHKSTIELQNWIVCLAVLDSLPKAGIWYVYMFVALLYLI